MAADDPKSELNDYTATSTEVEQVRRLYPGCTQRSATML